MAVVTSALCTAAVSPPADPAVDAVAPARPFHVLIERRFARFVHAITQNTTASLGTFKVRSFLICGLSRQTIFPKFLTLSGYRAASREIVARLTL